MATTSRRPLRADAQRNRDAILRAARAIGLRDAVADAAGATDDQRALAAEIQFVHGCGSLLLPRCAGV